MKSWWIRTRNGVIDLEARDVQVPQAGADEIVLRVHATALNRAEFNIRYRTEGVKPGGIEAAGVVEAVGEGVDGIKPGDRIMGRAGSGFAEYALLKAYDAIPVPGCLTWEQAAAVPLAFLVTYDMLYPYGKLQAGEWLLVTAVSSGVGVACLQTGKLLGAKVIGTSGSADKLAKLKALGLDAGIHTRSADFAARTKAVSGGNGVDLIVNNVGGGVFPECLRALAFQGRLATVGSVDGVMKCELDLEALHSQRLELFGVSNRFTTSVQRARTVRGFIRNLLPAFADGRITPVIDRIFTFDELPAARDYMESNAQVGRIVMRVS
jgi:NADPH:quinone reductase-like Zn-dependent oxidoreductase